MLAATAMLAMSANAALYITGAGFDPAWDASAPKEFTLVDGVYVYEGEHLSQFKISTAMGDWDTFNGGALCADVTGLNGEWVDLTPGDGNIGTPYVAVDPAAGKIEVKEDLSQIKVTMISPEAVGAPEAYLRGDMNNWGNDEENLQAWKMNYKEEGGNYIYTFTCNADQKIEVGQGFKIADKDWNIINYGMESAEAEPFMLDVEGIMNYNGPNCGIEEEWNGAVTFTMVSVLKEPASVLFTNETGVKGIESAEDGVAEYFNLQGVRVNNADKGLYIVVKNGKAQKIVK